MALEKAKSQKKKEREKAEELLLGMWELGQTEAKFREAGGGTCFYREKGEEGGTVVTEEPIGGGGVRVRNMEASIG